MANSIPITEGFIITGDFDTRPFKGFCSSFNGKLLYFIKYTYDYCRNNFGIINRVCTNSLRTTRNILVILIYALDSKLDRRFVRKGRKRTKLQYFNG